MTFRRMLMNAVDDAALTSTAVPTAAPAPTAAPTVTPPPTPRMPTATEIVAALQQDTAMRDAVMANLRRGGALATPKVAAETMTPQSTAPTAPAEQPSVAQSVRTELARMRALDQAVLVAGIKPTTSQVMRMEAAFAAENPPDAATWAAGYVADMFVVSAPPTATTVTPPQSTPAPAATIPPPAVTPTSATNLPGPPPPLADPSARRLIDMNDGERNDYRKKFGDAAFAQKHMAEMRNVRVTLKK